MSWINVTTSGRVMWCFWVWWEGKERWLMIGETKGGSVLLCMGTYLTLMLARQAVRRRFDKRIYIPLPELKARQHMFKVSACSICLFCLTCSWSSQTLRICVQLVLLAVMLHGHLRYPEHKPGALFLFLTDSLIFMWLLSHGSVTVTALGESDSISEKKIGTSQI